MPAQDRQQIRAEHIQMREIAMLEIIMGTAHGVLRTVLLGMGKGKVVARHTLVVLMLHSRAQVPVIA